MEQDIEILEELLNAKITFTISPTDYGWKALEHLIKAYKELEEENTEVKECLEVTSKALDNVAYDQIPIAIADLMIPKALVEEKILNPMKEEYDKAIKGFIKRDIPQCIEDGGIAQDLGYFIGKIEELLEKRK